MDAQGVTLFSSPYLFYFSYGECISNLTDENYFYSQETRGIGKSMEWRCWWSGGARVTNSTLKRTW